jgi:hypothetical protein
MKIVEYKKHLINGVNIIPEFIHDGNYFYDNDTKTWIGLVLDSSDREYYVPDTLTELTDEELIARQLVIHSNNSITKLEIPSDPHSNIITLTEEEVISNINDWLVSKGLK